MIPHMPLSGSGTHALAPGWGPSRTRRPCLPFPSALGRQAYIEFDSAAAALKAKDAIHGRMFAGNLVQVCAARSGPMPASVVSARVFCAGPRTRGEALPDAGSLVALLAVPPHRWLCPPRPRPRASHSPRSSPPTGCLHHARGLCRGAVEPQGRGRRRVMVGMVEGCGVWRVHGDLRARSVKTSLAKNPRAA